VFLTKVGQKRYEEKPLDFRDSSTKNLSGIPYHDDFHNSDEDIFVLKQYKKKTIKVDVQVVLVFLTIHMRQSA